MTPYLDQVRRILDEGVERRDRTDTGTLSLFGMQARYDLREGFPLVTTKRVFFKSIVRELLFFLRGHTNVEQLHPTKIWDAWADEDGELGPIYGAQWRNWGGEGIDQLAEAMRKIREEPWSRRIIVSAWNVSDLDDMALPPCHTLFQFYVDPSDRRLDLQLYQRSADMALGVPFNIASYSLLLTIVAQRTGLTPGVFVHTLGDAHIYLDHVEGLQKQLEREPFERPSIRVADKPIDELQLEDIELIDYQHHPRIRFAIAV